MDEGTQSIKVTRDDLPAEELQGRIAAATERHRDFQQTIAAQQTRAAAVSAMEAQAEAAEAERKAHEARTAAEALEREARQAKEKLETVNKREEIFHAQVAKYLSEADQRLLTLVHAPLTDGVACMKLAVRLNTMMPEIASEVQKLAKDGLEEIYARTQFERLWNVHPARSLLIWLGTNMVAGGAELASRGLFPDPAPRTR